ncbi:hypothetical protein [Paraburkholderia hayleyella]|nr:hypothetical protein [Paraburkholderia hayleyella]
MEAPGISANVKAQIDQMQKASDDENAMNLANTQAKLATMGLKAAKELVG